MKSYKKCLVVLLIFLGISPQDASTATLFNNEHKLEMVVEVFHDLEFNKIDNIKLFISHKQHFMNTDLEYRMYKKLFKNRSTKIKFVYDTFIIANCINISFFVYTERNKSIRTITYFTNHF